MEYKKFDEILELADTITTTGTATGTNIYTDFAGTVWKDRVVQYGEALRRFDQVCLVDKSLVGNGAQTVSIPKGTSHLDIDTSKSGGEAAARDTTAIDNLDAVSFTIAASDYREGQVTVSKAAEQTSMVNLVAQARYVVSEALAQDVDTAIATALQSTSVTNVVYGGSGVSAVDGLSSGDTFHADLVADAMEKIESANFVPYALFINTKQLRELRKDSQFTNASEYGSDEVVLKGQVGDYLGVKVITTTNTPTYAASATDVNETSKTWAVAGNTCILVGRDKLDRNVAAGLIWKELPTVGYEYELEKNLHHIYYDQCFKAGIIQEDAVCLIKVAQD